MSDQVPFDVWQIAQGVRFPGKLLHPVLAENAETGGVGSADVLGGKSLAHGHQCDFAWIARRAAGSGCYPVAHLGDISCDRHKVSGVRGTAELRSAGRPRAAVPTWFVAGRGRAPSPHEHHPSIT